VHREEGGEIAAGRGDRHVPNSFALVWVGSTHSNGGYSHATIWSGNTTTVLRSGRLNLRARNRLRENTHATT
jgi:hypothetical protein